MDQAQRSARGWEARKNGYPYHTKDRTEPLVYHVLSVCSDGTQIESENLRTGGFGRRLCDECIAQISTAHDAKTQK
jgi:hypothetical protein